MFIVAIDMGVGQQERCETMLRSSASRTALIAVRLAKWVHIVGPNFPCGVRHGSQGGRYKMGHVVLHMRTTATATPHLDATAARLSAGSSMATSPPKTSTTTPQAAATAL